MDFRLGGRTGQTVINEWWSRSARSGPLQLDQVKTENVRGGARAQVTGLYRCRQMQTKVAFYWCASCGGCEETVVDLAEGILDVVAAVDIVFWPVALDFKRKDVEAMPDGSIARPS